MNTRSKSKILLITAGVLALLGIGFYIFLIYHIESKGEKIAALENEKQTIERQTIDVAALAASLRATEADRAALSSYFVDSENAATFLEAIESISTAAGVSLKFSSVDIVTDTPLPQLKVNAKATGSFKNLSHFIQMLETMPYEISFSKASLKRTPVSAEVVQAIPEWQFEFVINLTSFIVK